MNTQKIATLRALAENLPDTQNVATAAKAETHERRDGTHALQGLLTICSDGASGYRRAAASVRASHLQAILQRNGAEREEIANVLSSILVDLGAKHDHAGTLKGAVHRGLLGALAVAHADDAIVRECARGDQMTFITGL